MLILFFASFTLTTFNSCEEIGNEIEKTPEKLIVGYWLDEGDVFDAEYYFSSSGDGYIYITRGWDIELMHFNYELKDSHLIVTDKEDSTVKEEYIIEELTDTNLILRSVDDSEIILRLKRK